MMSETYSGDLESAFDVLLQEIDFAIENVSIAGSLGLSNQDHISGRRAADMIEWFKEFRGKVWSLKNEWEAAQHGGVYAGKEHDLSRSRVIQTRKGRNTPYREFMRPILEALIELNGAGYTSEILDMVGDKMSSMLNPIDFEPLPSNPKNLRWKVNANTAKSKLLDQGLLTNSKRGIWEISEKGLNLMYSEYGFYCYKFGVPAMQEEETNYCEVYTK